jgi:hypothetical protein
MLCIILYLHLQAMISDHTASAQLSNYSRINQQHYSYSSSWHHGIMGSWYHGIMAHSGLPQSLRTPTQEYMFTVGEELSKEVLSTANQSCSKS